MAPTLGSRKAFKCPVGAAQEVERLIHQFPNTIARFERGEEIGDSTVATIRAALEAAGVKFIPENG